MLTHSKIWTAIDALARRYGLSPSGLAKRAGLDATAFNRSKRVTPEGRPRWPTTESVAKVLAATGASLTSSCTSSMTRGQRCARYPSPSR
jgi:phage repressor protein C with HTH and peptisase S24 domain